jgi:hypothetical protein
MRSWISGSVAAIVLVAAPVCAAALQSLSVVSEKGTFPYKVELANDDASRMNTMSSGMKVFFIHI